MKRVIIFVDGSANDRDSIACAATFRKRLDGRLSVVHLREHTLVATSPEAPVLVESAHELAEREAVAKAAIGESVAVVWNRTIQSARAVRSALPILATAKEVEILIDLADANVDPGELQAYLECHGITASARTFDGARLTARGRGRAIIAAASDRADLLVMGAFGENRLSALLGLGRTTQKIVSATPIPALLQT